ncbi:hypothetical protein M2152_000783 [Microbacteriaceae bacterium SG_E_30_P1]|uniref:Uncharacterized protein n=1 Tax=Antiquaquibacter oligotrophicus TaxID=2880260 RepID=A0ABT6KKV1_9MICO|nr:glutaminase [Antiquaquibacter oligotrophicus]MDH6180601.1 hypothetical protein [Antiquaquibacter oligotrophicus]UDF13666.1 glutaminase [Antiquaquibacter oligotrophicus]
MTALADLLAHVVLELSAAAVPDEALGQLREARRLGPITRPPAFVAVGRAWRLGDLLVTSDGRLLATGHVVRAIVPKDFAANKGPAEAQRRELQRAAARGKFRPGESVNYGFRDAVGDTVVERDGRYILRLSYADVPLETYLSDRVRLAIAPGPD